MLFRPARRKRQYGIMAVQRLNRSFFIDTEDGGVLGRVHVQGDDVCCLLLELRIVTGHVPFQSMRLDASLAPDPLDRGFSQPERARQLST